MEKLNAKTKKAQQLIENYLNADCSELWEAYGSYSHAKQNAMDYCKSKQAGMNGWGGRICTHCVFTFTYAFRCGEHSQNLVYITPSHDYLIENAF